MLHEPENLPVALLKETLGDRWGLQITELAYAPVGFGSHHWIAVCADDTRRFVTADHVVDEPADEGVETPFARLRAAFGTARALRAAGLEFVLAPEADRSHEATALCARQWSVAVFPFVAGEAVGPGPWEGIADAVEAARLVGRLHEAPPPHGIPRWRHAIGHREALMDALADLNDEWRAEPYGEPARRLLARRGRGVKALLKEYDRLARVVVASPEPWVVTHGEPHSANFLRAATGEMLLIDWDTVLLAPRERDLGFRNDEVFDAYREVAGYPANRIEALELFRVRWTLEEICGYARRFRQPHAGTEDDVLSWQVMQEELAKVP